MHTILLGAPYFLKVYGLKTVSAARYRLLPAAAPFGLGVTPFNRIAYCRRRGDARAVPNGGAVHGWVSEASAMLMSGLGTTGTSSASWTFTANWAKVLEIPRV
jgi:hypothetical protein